jgi:transposase-like protein
MLTKEPKRKYNALEQCRAVLLVWSERRSMKDVCRELKISGSLLAYWQDKAMEGLIAALTPREGREVAEKGPSLSISIKRLLEKKVAEQEGKQRAQARMAGIAMRMVSSSPPGVTTEG